MASPRVTLRLHGLAHGGDAVGRLPDGKVCFVSYGIPGETVVAEITEDRKRFARGLVVEVVEPSPHRVPAPCPHFGADRCGGCRIQHIDPAHQAELLGRVVAEQLERIGKIADPPVRPTVRPHSGDGLGYRNRARMSPDAEGRLGYRRAHSHDIEPIDQCPLLEPAAAALRERAGDDWEGVADVTFRSDASGRTMLEVVPGPGALPPLPEGDDPVAVVGTDGAVGLRGEPGLREQVAGLDLRVSATSFFQTSRAAAEELVRLVLDAAQVNPGDVALDCYAGVGLFSAALGRAGARVTAVEGHPAAADDARENLRPYGGEVDARPVGEVVGEWAGQGRQADVVVLDPPRRGAGEDLAAALSGLARQAIVYVACDPAALARDVRALSERGWRLEEAVPVDQFTHTAHIEVVATLRPGGA